MVGDETRISNGDALASLMSRWAHTSKKFSSPRLARISLFSWLPAKLLSPVKLVWGALVGALKLFFAEEKSKLGGGSLSGQGRLGKFPPRENTHHPEGEIKFVA